MSGVRSLRTLRDKISSLFFLIVYAKELQLYSDCCSRYSNYYILSFLHITSSKWLDYVNMVRLVHLQVYCPFHHIGSPFKRLGLNDLRKKRGKKPKARRRERNTTHSKWCVVLKDGKSDLTIVPFSWHVPNLCSKSLSTLKFGMLNMIWYSIGLIWLLRSS